MLSRYRTGRRARLRWISEGVASEREVVDLAQDEGAGTKTARFARVLLSGVAQVDRAGLSNAEEVTTC